MSGSFGGRRLDRRTVLTAGAALLGAGSIAKIVSTPGIAEASTPPAWSWKALKAQLDGSLLRPGDAGYTAAVRTFDPRRDDRRPLGIVRAASAHDVAAAFAFVRAYSVHPRPRSGGHSYVGASTGNGVLVIDVGQMAQIHYHADTHEVTVGAGIRLGDLHAALDPHGRTVPTGTCPTVGAAGLTLGGGIGTESRLYGLTADALVGATLVTPGGQILTPDTKSDADLLWGLRGGGGGNFGIVTSLVYETMPAMPGTIFRLSWNPGDSHRVLMGWQERLAQMPRHTWANLHLDTPGGTVTPRITGVCWGTGATKEINALVQAIGRSPVSRQTYSESHAGAMDWFAGGAAGRTRQSWYAGSDVFGHTVTSAGARNIITAVSSWNGSGSATAIVDPLGGAVGDRAVTATAFPWRTAHATVQWYVGLTRTTSGNLTRAADWVSRCHTAVQACSVGGYINYVEPRRPLASYYGSNWNRLLALNSRYDPHGILNSSYSLPG